MIPAFDSFAEQPPGVEVLVLADMLEHAAATIGETLWTPTTRHLACGAAAALRCVGPVRVDQSTLRVLLLSTEIPALDVWWAAREKESFIKGEAWATEWAEGLALVGSLCAHRPDDTTEEDPP